MTLHREDIDKADDKPLESLSFDIETSPEMLAKNILKEAFSPISEDIESLNKQLVQLIPAETTSTSKILNHVLGAGGKRIRPALFFLSANLVEYTGKDRMKIAAVCEYIHTASLLHDDVVDSSSLRRNKPTANSLWGDQASVLVGDLIYARASELMADTGSLEIVKTFANAIRVMSDGELFQLENVFDLATTEETYFHILERKTAALIASCCKTAAILANRPTSEIEALSAFGNAIGISFQLVDDALDYLGSRELFGKPTLSDILEGKVTLPVILLKNLATPSELDEIKAILALKKAGTAEAKRVAELVNQYDTADKTIEIANSYTERALQALAIFPDSKAKSDLETIAKRLVWRFN